MDILGGQAVQASRLLQKLGHEPSLWIGFLPINPRLRSPLHVLQKPKYLRTVVTFILYTSKLLWTLPGYEVLHVFSAGLTSYSLWTIPALLISKLYGKRVILNYRDGQGEQHIQTFRSAKPTIRMADTIIAPSDFLVDVFARHGIPARSIFNIIDLDRFIYRQRKKLRPVFMTNRILEPLYNVECLLRAFAVIQHRYPEASLTIAHDGPSRPSLEKLARDLRLCNTRFIGRVPHDRVPSLYNDADIYVTTPNIDCMPGSLLECFASGLPVVATNAGGIPYIVEDGKTGLLAGLDDYEGVARCCCRLLEDEELVVRLTTNAREEVKRYSWACVREQWLTTYYDLARCGR